MRKKVPIGTKEMNLKISAKRANMQIFFSTKNNHNLFFMQ